MDFSDLTKRLEGLEGHLNVPKTNLDSQTHLYKTDEEAKAWSNVQDGNAETELELEILAERIAEEVSRQIDRYLDIYSANG